MNPDRFARMKELLLKASELPEEKRKAYFDQVCGDDPELRLEAETILADGTDLSAVLQQAGDLPTTAIDPESATQPIPTKIAGYRLERIIGQGGMGVVYEAEQEKPRRTVALKVMRTGIASKSALRRFEYESQLLARLTHPGIAQVYEAGTYDDGMGPVPYFAMEYVPDARSIIDYAEEKKLGTRERLELFTQVCDAVHHGHQKGIIHRDLKPGNILVNPDGRVKIIDFGVARSTDSDMALTTLQTDVGQLIGTLQYMSPEQCAADPHDIDTRSDVYALGVVQYELLCGRLPYDVRQKAFHEVTRVIREEPPTRPSSISKQLRGDVETITLKALEKERDRRYQSAVELAQDIRRYLSGEAIIGRPPSIVYQIQIFARRHKAIFGALTAIFIVLAVGLAVSSGMYFRAERERDRALASEAEAETVIKFLSDTLASVDPAVVQGREMTIEGMLDKAAKDIDMAFPDQPLVEATLRATIGRTYYALGNYPAAKSHLETALELRKRELGGEHPDTLASMSILAFLYRAQGRYDEAESLFVRTLELQRRVLGEEHPDTLSSMHFLAYLHSNQGRFDESKPLLVQAVERRRRVLGEEHPDTLSSMAVLAYIYMAEGRFDKAESLYQRTLELQRHVLGEEHPDTLSSMHFLAWLHLEQGRYDEAELLYVRTLELRRRVLGEKHPDTLASLNDMAYLHLNQGRYEEAESLYLLSLELYNRVLGEEHPFTLYSHWGLARTMIKQSRYQDAEILAIDYYKKIIKVYGHEHWEMKDTIELFIDLYDAWGKPDQAAEWRAKLPEPVKKSESQPTEGASE